MKTFSHHFAGLVFSVLAFGCCAVTNGEELVMRTAKVPLSHDFAKRVAVDHHDACRVMADFGIDYPVLVQQALDGHPRAIRLILSLPWIARFDGAVAESYAATRYKIVMLVGDEKLVSAITPMKQGLN